MPKIKPQAIPSGAMMGYKWPYIISLGAIDGEGLNPLNYLTKTYIRPLMVGFRGYNIRPMCYSAMVSMGML